MWHLLVWLPISMLLGLWSLFCWAAHALLANLPWGDTDSLDWPTWLERWQIPAWLADWLPMHAITAIKVALTDLLSVWGPWLGDLMQQAPEWVNWLLPVLWVVWGVGVLGLLLVGVVGSVLVFALRGPKPVPVPQPGR